ncbi:MAG TPA: hypothetical protein PLK94_01660 [Alphaproteobacteria bacterium]|nr:hypothetical protein [Alphaproteobacteria bacterium]
MSHLIIILTIMLALAGCMQADETRDCKDDVINFVSLQPGGSRSNYLVFENEDGQQRSTGLTLKVSGTFTRTQCSQYSGGLYIGEAVTTTVKFRGD